MKSQYKANLRRVISPVTLEVRLHLWPGLHLDEPIRLNGVSMPQSGADMVRAVSIIDEWVNKYPLFVVQVLKEKGKPWGRYLGNVLNRHGESLNEKLVNAGVVEEIPECEIPEEEKDLEEPPENVEVEEVPEPEEEQLPDLPEPELESEPEAETPSEPTEEGEEEKEAEDLFEEEDREELEEEFEEAVEETKRWRLKRQRA